MLGARTCVRTVTTGFGNFSDEGKNASRLSSSPKLKAVQLAIPFRFGDKRRRINSPHQSQPILSVSCKSSRGSFGGRSSNANDRDHDFLEASLLLSGPFSLFLIYSVEEDTVRFDVLKP